MESILNSENNSIYRVVNDDVKTLIEEEIGDVKQQEFYPQVKVKTWDNESNFSIRLITDEMGVYVFNPSESKTTHLTSNMISNFYPKDEEGEWGGHEFETIINSKPNTNVINYSIRYKNVDFYYQGELTEEDIELGCNRPENVVGSYAVYSSFTDNFINGKNYYTGKICHIYRPFVIDSSNNKVWCDMKINDDKSILSITIPQDFLDNATYPILLDPTLGYTSVGASSTNLASPWATGPFTLPAGQTVEYLTLYSKSTDGTSVPYILGLYADTGATVPGARLAISQTGSISGTTDAWQSGRPLTYYNASSQPVWFAQNASATVGKTIVIYYDTGRTGLNVRGSTSSENYSYPTLLDPFKAVFNAPGWSFSIYATYVNLNISSPKLSVPLLLGNI